MESLYVLVPLSVLLVLAVIGLFWWALGSDQFEDLEREGLRVLDDDDAAAGAPAAAPPPAAVPGAADGAPLSRAAGVGAPATPPADRPRR
jgi:cbb3-type cytochrome oxidase maturation protein